MKQDESGNWVFSSGSESETVEAKRKEQWRSNFSLSKTDEANWFRTLCEKYFIPEDLSDDMKVKILALWQESRMNNYNSTPCTIALDVGFETVSEIEVRSMELDGVEISESTSRVYPQGTTACHVIGYVSKISTESLEDYRAKGYPNDALIGSDGIERSLEDQLSPYISYRQGQRVIERNTRGKVVRELDYIAPTDGNSAVLTIDVDLQNVMREALVDNIEYIRQQQEETVASDRWQRRKKDILDSYAEQGREDEVRVVVRNIAEGRKAPRRNDALAPNAAGADGDLRVDDLSRVVRIRFGIKPDQNARCTEAGRRRRIHIHPIRQREQCNCQNCAPDQLRIRAGDEYHDAENRDVNHRRAEVRLEDDQHQRCEQHQNIGKGIL